MADAAGCALALKAFHRPDREDAGLPDFYEQFGFVVEAGPDEAGYLEMVRTPRCAPEQNQKVPTP